MCSRCNYDECIGSGIPCSCGCHTQAEFDAMKHTRSQRLAERCEDCRWSPITCSVGRCFCTCHGDRPVRRGTAQVCDPGHDALGRERAFEHQPIWHPAVADGDILFTLRDAYREAYERGTHVEETVGGADWHTASA